jgi:phosphonate transport system permease protein
VPPPALAAPPILAAKLGPAAAAIEARHRADVRAGRWRQLGIVLLLLALSLASGWYSEFSATRLLEGLPGVADYVGRTLPVLRAESLGADLREWYWNLGERLLLLVDTALIAYVGTVVGAGLALLLSFPASARHTPHPALAFAVRRVLETARSVPVLVFALIFVFAFGLGPLPGAMALAVHTMGALGKLYAEIHENAEAAPVEAVRAAGGSWVQQMRFGVLPQSMPGVVSYGLLRFEINVREASILGFVGAGGIGEELYTVVRRFEYADISALVLLILATVTLLDFACTRLRRRITGALSAA